MNESQKKKCMNLRTAINKNKTFLKSVYSDPKRKAAARLSLATIGQTKVLLRVLHYLCNGHIPMKKANFEKVKSARKISTLHKIRSREDLVKFMKLPKSEQISFLNKFLSLYPLLLHPLFNEY